MAQIKLSIEDLKNQQIRMSSLAERLNAQTERYNNALKRLKDATEGRYSLNMAAKATVTLKMMRELTDNIRMGAQVAQTCIDRFQATDADLANKTNPANPENVMKETIPAAAYGGALLNSEITNSVQQTSTGNLVQFPYKEKCYSGVNSDGTHPAGDYSGYSVVPGFNINNCWYQGSYPGASSSFKSSGCVSCSDAVVGSITKGITANPLDTWNKAGYTSCKYTSRDINTVYYTPEQQMQYMYDQLIEGKPCIARVQCSNGTNGHSVAVIGLRTGADRNNLTQSDFLIADSGAGDGKEIMNLNETYGRNGKRNLFTYTGKKDDGYGIRIAK